MQIKYLITLIVFLVLNNSCFSQDPFYKRLADSTITLTCYKVTYEPGYYSIAYPNGDIPQDKGVCTDVVIRAYRKLGIDLQKEVHEDMKANFEKYPKNWGLKTTDKNIDHRRVPNLMRFFERHGDILSTSGKGSDYTPGDIVCWNLGGGTTHIGIIVDKKTNDNSHNLVVHNIGAGQVVQDCLLDFPIIGHYRYKK